MINQKDFEELTRRCGEIDFLMGRLKTALEAKIGKEDVLSPYERWISREMQKEREESKKFDEELKRIIEEGRKGNKGGKG